MITLKCSLNKSIISCDVKQPYMVPVGSINKNMLSVDLQGEINKKVDKVTGKGLIDTDVADNISIKNYGTNDVFTVATPEVDFKFVNAETINIPTADDIHWGTNTTLQTELDKKVDKITGKGLSINDYTDTDKAEVAKVKDKVGFTDYATDTKVGVVKVDSIKGIKVNESGGIGLNVPDETAIAQRLPVNSNLPITIGNLDYAVRSVHPITSNSIPDTLAVNTIYRLSEIETLTLNLPFNDSIGANGNFIQVDFYSGKTQTNLMITSAGGLSDIDLSPEPNTMYSLFFDWGLVYCHTTEAGAVLQEPGWRFSYAEYHHKEV